MDDSLLLRHGWSGPQFVGILVAAIVVAVLLLFLAVNAALNRRLVIASVSLLLSVLCICGFIYGLNHANSVADSENRRAFSSAYSVPVSDLDGMGIVGSTGRWGRQISVGNLMDGRSTGSYQVKYGHDGVIRDITVQIAPSDDGNRLKVYDSKGKLIRPGTPISSKTAKG